MLEYAVKLTKDPCGCKKKDVDALRKLGFKDADILLMVEVIAYYNYVNRTACGLGVELEARWDQSDRA